MINWEESVGVIIIFILGFSLGLCVKTPSQDTLDRYEKMLETQETQETIIANEVLKNE